MGNPVELVEDAFRDPLSAITGGLLTTSGTGAREEAAEASKEAAATQAAYQQRALDYLMERERLPQQYREQALTELAGIYGIGTPGQDQQVQAFGGVGPGAMGASQLPEGWTGGEPFAGLPTAPPGINVVTGGYAGGQTPQTSGQDALIQRSIQSPLYQSIMGGREAGEEAILRSAAATGGLRSGNVQESLYDYNTQLQNQALLEAYNQQLSGLQGLAGLPSNATQIASGISGIGSTLAAGDIAAANAQQQAQQYGLQNLMGIANLGLTGYGLGLFSDRRLKTNIEKIGNVKGYNWYKWDWNVVGNNIGLNGSCEGCLADEVYKEKPEAVVMKDGFMMVRYDTLGIFNATGHKP